MADNQENRSGEDLTEDASPYRLEEARKKGQVAQSRELGTLVALLAAGASLAMVAPEAGKQLQEFSREVFSSNFSVSNGANNLDHLISGFMTKGIKLTAILIMPMFLAAAIIGTLGSLMQTGFIFSFDPLMPDIEKINPLKGLQRLFSQKKLFESIRMIAKVTAVFIAAYIVLKPIILGSAESILKDPLLILDSYRQVGSNVFFTLCGVLGVFAGFDFWLEKWDFDKSMKMTKQEAKQEHKEREGDPQIKARIRSVQREIARRRMMEAVKKADVIVTNPTHIAVALIYNKDAMSAPKVVAKGADFLAQRIKQIALESGVPLVENVPLARALYKSVKVGKFVPKNLYQAVAEVLAYIYRLKKKKFV